MTSGALVNHLLRTRFNLDRECRLIRRPRPTCSLLVLFSITRGAFIVLGLTSGISGYFAWIDANSASNLFMISCLLFARSEDFLSSSVCETTFFLSSQFNHLEEKMLSKTPLPCWTFKPRRLLRRLYLDNFDEGFRRLVLKGRLPEGIETI